MHKQSLINAIKMQGKCSDQDAEKVIKVYIFIKVVKVTAHEGYVLKHGQYLDAHIIKNAITFPLHETAPIFK